MQYKRINTNAGACNVFVGVLDAWATERVDVIDMTGTIVMGEGVDALISTAIK